MPELIDSTVALKSPKEDYFNSILRVNIVDVAGGDADILKVSAMLNCDPALSEEDIIFRFRGIWDPSRVIKALLGAGSDLYEVVVVYIHLESMGIVDLVFSLKQAGIPLMQIGRLFCDFKLYNAGEVYETLHNAGSNDNELNELAWCWPELKKILENKKQEKLNSTVESLLKELGIPVSVSGSGTVI